MGLIGSTVLTFIGRIQTDRLIDRQGIYEDMKIKYSLNMNLFISRLYGGRFPNLHKQNLTVFQDFRLDNILILKYLYLAYTMHCNMHTSIFQYLKMMYSYYF